MKNILLASVGLLALGVASASAADLPRRHVAVQQETTTYVAPVYNWTGLYLGINGGGGFGNSRSGGLFGATLGYNWQMGQFVTGLEGDIDWTNIRGTNGCGGFSCETRNSWLGTVRGRLGFAADRFMPYVTGGLAFGDIRTNVPGIGDTRTTKTGYALGAGVEAALAGPWTAKIEYLHVDLGRATSIVGTDTSFRTDIVRAGLNYRF